MLFVGFYLRPCGECIGFRGSGMYGVKEWGRREGRGRALFELVHFVGTRRGLFLGPQPSQAPQPS